jgi:hypothetical protein
LIFTRPQNGFHLKKYTEVAVSATAKLCGRRMSLPPSWRTLPWVDPLALTEPSPTPETATLKASARKRFAMEPTGLPMVARTSGPSMSGPTASSRFFW